MRQVEQKIEQALNDNEYGLWKGRGTHEAIMVWRIVIRKWIQTDIDTFIAYIDF